MKRYLGVDPGQRWTGLALSDEAGLIARPHKVVDRENESLSDVLVDVIQEFQVNEIIVGYPTPLQTDENERTRQVDQFIERFIEPLDCPYHTMSERYSTKEARRLREKRNEGASPGDDEAAAMILDWYLERNRESQPSPMDEGKGGDPS